MNYSDLLKKYIDTSGLSLSEVEDKMRGKGFATNKAYISRLQNGKIPPAGDDINKALAEVTGGDSDELIIQANIEKSPILKELIETIMSAFIDYVKNNKSFLLMMTNKDPDNNEKIKNLTQDVFSDDQKIEDLFHLIPFKMRISFIVLIFQSISKQKIEDSLDIFEGKVQDKIQSAKNLFKAMGLNNKGRPRMNDVSEELNEDELIFLRKSLETYRELKLKPSDER